ncbi:MAG: transglycosylase domain-containing protein [Candidatus Latescibacterota bacterium]
MKTKGVVVGVAGVLAVACVALGIYELRASRLQSHYLSRLAQEATFEVGPGPSPQIRYPSTGPYDLRLGYAQLPDFIDRLQRRGYVLYAQARPSERFLDLMDRGLFPIYPEKTQAGVEILDRGGQLLFEATCPERVYPAYRSIPELVVRTLLFIENRELLDDEYPYRNPAVEWDRLALASMDLVLRVADPDHRVPGGSTLATQIEKYRHSPEGLTGSVPEKARQMVSASLRAYQKGPVTLEARRDVVRDYINSMPLAAFPAYGEVIGLGDGLWVWYGADFDRVNHLLSRRIQGMDARGQAEWGLAYRQVLSLFIAQRRPSYYLGRSPETLSQQADTYLGLLAQAGAISTTERQAAGKARLRLRQGRLPQPEIPFVERKAANSIRARLFPLLEVPQLYELDRLDLTVTSTLDRATQAEVTRVLRELCDPEKARQAGLREFRLLEVGDPSRVVYSFTLYQTGQGANLLRVQTDNLNQPLNINEGIKLELGSTAKLRALVSYLNVIAAVHGRYADAPRRALDTVSVAPRDKLSRWAIDYLRGTEDRNLPAMLEAALERRYSASPGEAFFTGGGLHTFVNFDPEDDGQVFSVRQGLQNSVNLVFIRIMRDVVQYYIYQKPDVAGLLSDDTDERRRGYLERFADREGTTYMNRFYRSYAGKSKEEALAILLERFSHTPPRLAAVHRYVVPDAGRPEFGAFMRSTWAGELSERNLDVLYERYGPEAYNLADRGYICRVHPLELWMVAYMRQNPQASRGELMKAAAQARQETYTWLFKTHHTNRQNSRITTLLETEAFQDIHREWKRLGYPFEFLVPSYATAIGSSADRPAALAELAGILLNNGVRYPANRIEELHFAQGTPFETHLRRQDHPGEQVLHPAVAAAARQELLGVVEHGTGRRVFGVFTDAAGNPLPVGGKTGTGDNRLESYATGGRVIESKAINRTATFVFTIGDRFFGVLTAYVEGKEADRYKFTSALPVQVLKHLEPALSPLLREGLPAPVAVPAEAVPAPAVQQAAQL